MKGVLTNKTAENFEHVQKQKRITTSLHSSPGPWDTGREFLLLGPDAPDAGPASWTAGTPESKLLPTSEHRGSLCSFAPASRVRFAFIKPPAVVLPGRRGLTEPVTALARAGRLRRALL